MFDILSTKYTGKIPGHLTAYGVDERNESGGNMYRVVNVRANKQLINRSVGDPTVVIVNTTCTSKEDIDIALDTKTDIITLKGFIRISKGMIGKMKEKKIYLNLGIYESSFFKNFMRLFDMNGLKILCLSTFAEKETQIRTKNEMGIILKGLELKKRKIEKILNNWNNVIYRRMKREGGMGDVNRKFIQDYINNVEF